MFAFISPQTDWNNGEALTSLVKSIGGIIPPRGASDPNVMIQTGESNTLQI